jgi:hypothetical protein
MPQVVMSDTSRAHLLACAIEGLLGFANTENFGT